MEHTTLYTEAVKPDNARSSIEPILNGERFARLPVNAQARLRKALDFATKKIKKNIATFPPGLYPAPASVDNVYPAVVNRFWTSAFWTGMLFLSWEDSADPAFLEAAQSHLGDYRHRLDIATATETHDLGFLYTLSCVASWKLTGNRFARETALLAADALMRRFIDKAGILQAWGPMGDGKQQGRIIVDCAMNLPLLYWASRETGNPAYADAAARHIRHANETLIRRDWSTFHTYYFDPETGVPLRGATHQGHSDSSCWARGQAWAIYGNALSFRYLRDPALLETARGVARYFLNRLPEDLVPRWDFIFEDDSENRDSSAASIAAAGLAELASHLREDDPDRATFRNAAYLMTLSLAESYSSETVPVSNGILLHGVYGKPLGNGVDECNLWGDYFFVEALTRLTKVWKPYW